MPRGLSTAAKAYKGPSYWAAKVTLRDGAVYQFAEDARTFGGVARKANLILKEMPEEMRTLEPPSCEIALGLADGYVEGELAAGKNFSMAKVELTELLLGTGEELLWFTGRVAEAEVEELALALHLVGEPMAGQIEAVQREFENTCTLRFSEHGCGYRRATAAATEQIAERTATSVEDDGITDSTLAMTVNAQAERFCLVTDATTGEFQVHKIKSNTATALKFWRPWVTKPTGTVKFKVFSAVDGLPKVLKAASTAYFERTSSGAGNTTLKLNDSGLAMVTAEHTGDWLRIVSGTGAGQEKKIAANSATQLLIDAASPFSPVPDATSVYRVLHDKCPRDLQSCDERGRLHEFNGFPTITRMVTDAMRRSGEDLDGELLWRF